MAEAAVSLWRREAMFLTAMLASETGIVGLNILFKVATSKGLNSYSFLGYSYLLASLLLLPSHLLSNRSRSLPPLSFSILCKIGLLGVIGSTYVITSYIGVKYSSPTLASAISNITPALTFILAVIFRYVLFVGLIMLVKVDEISPLIHPSTNILMDKFKRLSYMHALLQSV